jgi:hypothetical protein
MVNLRILAIVLPMIGALALADPSHAAQSFSYKTSYRNVVKDPDHVWSDNELSPLSNGAVTIHEYQLRTPQGDLLISQIWNSDCSAATCPTRLVKIDAEGRRTVLVDDMMHQIIPTDDPRFSSLLSSKEEGAFAQRPFSLSDDGKTLVNGDYKFPIEGIR